MTMTKRRFLGYTRDRAISGLILLLHAGAADLFADTLNTVRSAFFMSPLAHI